MELEGSWQLVAWRRIEQDGTVSFPLGSDARGLLTYAPDGRMSVVMTAAGRPLMDSSDPLGGDAQKRADAYSTCLAYAGTYEQQGETVIHRIEESLFPNWSGNVEPRSMSQHDGELVLRTPSQPGATVNELVWARPTGNSAGG